MGQTPRDRREVIDDDQLAQVQLLLEGRLREPPVEVDHLDVVAQDRSRDRKRGALRSIGGAPVVEVNAQQPSETGKIGVLEHLGASS